MSDFLFLKTLICGECRQAHVCIFGLRYVVISNSDNTTPELNYIVNLKISIVQKSKNICLEYLFLINKFVFHSIIVLH